MELERALVAVAMLIGAVWSDLKTRRVSNVYWWPFIVMAAIWFLADVAQGIWKPYLFSLGMTLFAYGLYYGRLFGGADAKGLMVLAWLVPGMPSLTSFLPALDALVNATFLSLLIPVWLLIFNAIQGRVSPAAFLGIRVPIGEAEQRHVWPMHHVVDGEVRWKVWQQIGTDLSGRYAALRAAGMTHVWVTPKIPFMVPILLGFLLAIEYGNLVMRVTIAYRF